jgi:hypothetical protein
MAYPPVIKHGNGKYIQIYILMGTSSINGRLFIAAFDYRRVIGAHNLF